MAAAMLGRDCLARTFDTARNVLLQSLRKELTCDPSYARCERRIDQVRMGVD